MIHIIPHHINKGSWIPWYDLIHFNESEEISYYKVDNPLIYEYYQIGQEEFPLHIVEHLKNINPKEGDSVMCDLQYFPYYESHESLYGLIEELAKKYKIKLFLIDTDNFQPYSNTEHYTIFSNRFKIENMHENFNYFRYRPVHEKYFNNVPLLFEPFLENIRQKKMNFIVGVDKIERLLSLKHIYDTQLNSDTYIGYSGFSCGYKDSDISDSLLNFRNSNIPIILDVPFDRSQIGAVNVEFPPFPLTLNSYVSAICETTVLTNEIHLSEKSWNPFISLNIPLILGSAEINDYLLKVGFWMANDIFDLSIQQNYVDIVTQFKNNLNVINSFSSNDLYDYFRENKNAMVRNHELLAKQKFVFNSNNYK